MTCAVLITSCETIDEILLVHPQDITDAAWPSPTTTSWQTSPTDEACAKWFDHHLLTESNERPPEAFDGRYGLAPSAARMVYEYYLVAYPGIQRFERLLAETDRLDSAQLNLDDVLDPREYILLGYTLDPRTGLGAYHDYFLKLVEWLKTRSIAEMLATPEVQERVETHPRAGRRASAR